MCSSSSIAKVCGSHHLSPVVSHSIHIFLIKGMGTCFHLNGTVWDGNIVFMPPTEVHGNKGTGFSGGLQFLPRIHAQGVK